ncbi:hypothetical protein TanjilG_11885 [Lupinus angustifolius]|uniref:K Homology domain-containing protein n=1 Tax=Lupinus angustifolius TaxID=3871 RepID=A0A394DAX9_LUPAN|nr:PREDICTED: RNA-binding KH domain-containing protein PEPPER-like [Lupinus angustifolius]OIW20482.1 hypothetical protein TanjilG_11885 [Lupinus angustifolius]
MATLNGATNPDLPSAATTSDATLIPEPPSATTPPEKRWPGWPGDCVFRLIVPVGKVGSIIGRKGELVKKICEETRARVRVLDGAAGTPDRIVLISGKEELDAALSPAMDAVMRIFKRVSGLSENDDDITEAAGAVFCSIRLLVASTQAINLIGKQGLSIRSIQESTSASVRVLSGDEVPFYAAADERIVEVQGEALKVLKALELIVGHLRKFLVDHSVLPLFEQKTYNVPITQDRRTETWPDKALQHTPSQTSIFADMPLATKRDSVFVDRESQLDSLLPPSNMSRYGQDSSLSSIRSSTLGRVGAPIVTTVIQTMQVPLSYAEDIIGIQGSNIDYIRRTSGAILTVQESRLPDEIIVEIKGSTSQVQMAQQLIQEVINSHNEPVTNSYSRLDAGLRSAYPTDAASLRSVYSSDAAALRSAYSSDTAALRSSYSQLGSSTSRSSASLPSRSYTGYGGSGLGDYSTFRL